MSEPTKVNNNKLSRTLVRVIMNNVSGILINYSTRFPNHTSDIVLISNYKILNNLHFLINTANLGTYVLLVHS